MSEPGPPHRTSIVLGDMEITFDSPNEDDQLHIWWNIDRTTKKPLLCCFRLCSAWALLLIALISLSITVAAINFTLGVPFYDRSEINQRFADAYTVTIDNADFLSGFALEGADGQCVHKDPTVLTRNGTLLQGPMPSASCQRVSSNELRLLYISKDRKSNILTPKNLEEIKKIEDRILNTLALTRYCVLIDSNFPPITSRDRDELEVVLTESAADTSDPSFVACERIFSVLNFMDDDYFDISGKESGLGYYLMPNDQYPQAYDLSSGNIESVVEYWSNFTRRTYDLTTLSLSMPSLGGNVTVDNLFLGVTSSDFVPGNGATESVGLTSSYPLGFAINDYASPTEDFQSQVKDAGQVLWETFDSFLKDASFSNVDVYWADKESGMKAAEEQYLAQRSFALFPVSIALVLVYIIAMQDSFFLGFAGITQILLTFIPTLLLYGYVIGEDYLGVLNIISFYIIIGIGVDDIFVFTDQFMLAGAKELDLTRRMQLGFQISTKAMFTTSATTFISFMANASSSFPAVRTFGIFSAMLVLCNFLAVVIYFPSVFAVYRKHIHHRWWDHPSLLFQCKKEMLEEKKESAGESGFTLFFKNHWTPTILKSRYVIVTFFLGIMVIAIVVASGLETEENAPTTIPEGNNYLEFGDVLLDYFGRTDNPSAIRVHMVSGIDPDDPIDYNPDDTNMEERGTPNFVGCDVFNPTTPEAQVWNLQVCHDMFFGNVTVYHENRNDMGVEGSVGPTGRRILDEISRPTEFNYYARVSCIAQGLRDWLLTDNGCNALQEKGLKCHNETSLRQDCVRWDTQGNSCEPYPLPETYYLPIFQSFLQDPSADPATQKTNFDKYASQLFVDTVENRQDVVIQADFSCRSDNNLALFAMTNAVGTTVQTFEQSFDAGLDLFGKWDDWAVQMRKFSPREMQSTAQSAQGAWAFYFLNETLLSETFHGIALSLGLSFAVMALMGGNVIMALYSVLTISLIVINVFAFTVIAGYSLGVIEAVLYVVVIGMSIDYSVHMSEAYVESHAEARNERVASMIAEMGVSVLSGALSTLLAALPMFFAPNVFFVKFASFLFVTIALSCIYALVFFPALLSIVGPLGSTGSLYTWLGRMKDDLFHQAVKRYVKSSKFARRESQALQESKNLDRSDRIIPDGLSSNAMLNQGGGCADCDCETSCASEN